MVGWIVHDQHVGCFQHHSGQLAADLFTPGQDLDLLVDLVAAEEHSAQEAPQEGVVVVFLVSVLAQPIQNRQFVIVEVGVKVSGHVVKGSRLPPGNSPGVWFQAAGDDFHQGRGCPGVSGQEGNLVTWPDDKGNIVQKLLVAGLVGHIVHSQQVVA